jgi:AraC-like DNA-binding protein
MISAADQNKWDDRFIDRHSWIDAMSSAGLHCRFDDVRSGNSVVKGWHDAGRLSIGEVELAWQCLSPVMNRCTVRPDEHLYLKVVQQGLLTIEQNGQANHFNEGSLILVDPLRAFNDYYREPTRVTVLRIPRSALRDRGFRSNFDDLCVPTLTSPDVKAVRDFVLCMARQSGETSKPLLARLGDQCLDLLDVVINDSSTRDRTGAVTVIRARQTIARLVGDPELSVARIASELNVSASYLTRTLQAHGLSPMSYAWSLRLEHAAGLLTRASKGAIQAKQVAFQCGFASASHFSRAFKKRYGMSPRAFAICHERVAATTADSLSLGGSNSGFVAIRTVGRTQPVEHDGLWGQGLE